MSSVKTTVILAALISVSLSFTEARARQAGSARTFGAGIAIGNPTGISGKYWIDRRHAIDGVFSVPSKNDVYLHGDYLWHDYKAFPPPEEGSLPLYYGVGGVASVERVGVRGVIGVEYIFSGYPFDLFIELAPVLNVAPDIGISMNGGLGGRYYFGG